MSTYSQTRVVPYTAEQMYALVAAVEHYPAFVPGCVGTRLFDHHDKGFKAIMTAGFGPIRQDFTSVVTLVPFSSVETRSNDGPFRDLHSQWRFAEVEGGCRVDFKIDFNFRTPLLSVMLDSVFRDVTSRTIQAFEDRAVALYGGHKRGMERVKGIEPSS